MHSYGLLVGWV